MKAWEVLAIVKNGEIICEDCLNGKDEHEAFHDKGNHEDIGVIFASDEASSDSCTRCGQPLSE